MERKDPVGRKLEKLHAENIEFVRSMERRMAPKPGQLEDLLDLYRYLAVELEAGRYDCNYAALRAGYTALATFGEEMGIAPPGAREDDAAEVEPVPPG